MMKHFLGTKVFHTGLQVGVCCFYKLRYNYCGHIWTCQRYFTYIFNLPYHPVLVFGVPASGVGNNRLSLIFRRQLSLSRGLTSIKLCADRSFLTHSDQAFLGIPRPRGPGIDLVNTTTGFSDMSIPCKTWFH